MAGERGEGLECVEGWCPGVPVGVRTQGSGHRLRLLV